LDISKSQRAKVLGKNPGLGKNWPITGGFMSGYLICFQFF
jgi:hypothetical protein